MAEDMATRLAGVPGRMGKLGRYLKGKASFSPGLSENISPQIQESQQVPAG